jgi:hypothetical protein
MQLVADFPTRRPVFEPRWGHVGFMVDKEALGHVVSQYFCFPCKYLFHQMLHIHLSFRNGAGTIAQLVADVPSGPSSNPITYLHTELSPSWGAVNCAAPQEPPSILWNPKVQYRVHKSPPLVPILSHINSIHSIASYLSKIHFNIVHPPTSWSS